ncbi:hypothetical protein M405DRAFT_324111 [Rhizopogon salebrosus TDB-379]|nr:hypothetical protein M405DRAFT_324111 [Rhizopogon salebrosus TDB-379]
MVDFPTPGTYRIKSTNYGCYAGIRNFQGRDMLCGVRETNNKWELAYVVDSTRDQPDQPICILVEVDPDGEPSGYLGVEDIRNDVSVNRMKDQKVWRLKKIDEGIV